MATIYTAVSFFNGDTHCIVTIGFSEPSVTRSQFSPISTASPFKSVKILVLINCATDFGSHASFSFSLYLSLSLSLPMSLSLLLSLQVFLIARVVQNVVSKHIKCISMSVMYG